MHRYLPATIWTDVHMKNLAEAGTENSLGDGDLTPF